MSQPPEGPQGGQPPQDRGDSSQQGDPRPPAPGPQGYPPQPARPGQPPYPQQGYPPRGGQPPQGYPPQGYPQQAGFPPQQGYAGQPPYAGAPQPYAPGPYQPGPYPPGPYAPVPGAPGPEPKKKRTGLFVLIGAGALALLLVVVAVAVNLGGKTETAGGGTTGGGGVSSSAPPTATASAAVEGYLQAVAKGDAKTAVSYALDSTSVSTTYMTPAVLAASAKLAPMTDIQVGTTSGPDATTVPVSYQLGSTRVSTSYDVMKTSDDAWKLVTVAGELDLTAVQDESVPLRINGLVVKPGPFSVLPGVYRVSSGQRNFDYGSHPDLVVRYPTDYPDTSRIAPQVSSKARADALSALRKRWSSCLRSRDPKPGGCPNRWTRSDVKFKKGTVRWSRKGSDPVKKPKASTYSTYTIYTVKIDLALRGTCTSGGRTGTCTGTLSNGTALARADYSADKVKVSWQT